MKSWKEWMVKNVDVSSMRLLETWMNASRADWSTYFIVSLFLLLLYLFVWKYVDNAASILEGLSNVNMINNDVIWEKIPVNTKSKVLNKYQNSPKVAFKHISLLSVFKNKENISAFDFSSFFWRKSIVINKASNGHAWSAPSHLNDLSIKYFELMSFWNNYYAKLLRYHHHENTRK